jgi:histidinol-phosphate/aromatic aminotransferase/cobyric acid decarboxylase-like protein
MLSNLSPIRLSTTETELLNNLEDLSAKSGSHSPSLTTIQRACPEISVEIDACYLSNPLATDLFWSVFNTDIGADASLFRQMLEAYPSQNRTIAENLSVPLNVDSDSLLIANGATEAIQAVIHNYSSHIHINTPTFSPYYEFAGANKQVTTFRLRPDTGFAIDPERYVDSVLMSNADTAVLISPNNPDGGLIPDDDLKWILGKLTSLKTVIVDESFIHFADRPGSDENMPTLTGITDQFSNVTVIKSMSKDFGIAGIRAGYAIMQPERVDHLLESGYLWNTNGLAEYFFSLFDRPTFVDRYLGELARYKQMIERFTATTASFRFLDAYETSANFQLMRMPRDVPAKLVTALLLLRYGIYVRDCDDKIGLDGEYIRVAIRTEQENVNVLSALADLLG